MLWAVAGAEVNNSLPGPLVKIHFPRNIHTKNSSYWPEMATLEGIIQRMFKECSPNELHIFSLDLSTRVPLQISSYFLICSGVPVGLLKANELGGVAYLQWVLVDSLFS